MKVTKIVESAFRTGEKNGKAWTLAKVELDDGTTATGFMPVAEGDEVEVTQNDYGLQFKTLKKQASGGGGSSDIDKMLNFIAAQNKKILSKLDSLLTGADGSPNTEEEFLGDLNEE